MLLTASKLVLEWDASAAIGTFLGNLAWSLDNKELDVLNVVPSLSLNDECVQKDNSGHCGRDQMISTDSQGLSWQEVCTVISALKG